MATLTAKVAAAAGVTLNLAQAASAGGDQYANNGRELVLVTNTGVASRTVTVGIPADATRAEGKTVGPRQVVVAAGTYVLLGPYKKALYNDPATGRVSLTYSTEADLKVEVIDPTPV